MKMKDIKKLHRGDEVFWTDPDGGKCSRHLKILSISVRNKDDITMVDLKGGVVQCTAAELS